MVRAFGIALVTTNFVAIVGFVPSVAMIELHVRVAEEPYLLAVHGDAYRDYVATVGGFIPGADLRGGAR
jgi:protein-S-isoprenylcysteine O-methyltransferase Ste14